MLLHGGKCGNWEWGRYRSYTYIKTCFHWVYLSTLFYILILISFLISISGWFCQSYTVQFHHSIKSQIRESFSHLGEIRAFYSCSLTLNGNRKKSNVIRKIKKIKSSKKCWFYLQFHITLGSMGSGTNGSRSSFEHVQDSCSVYITAAFCVIRCKFQIYFGNLASSICHASCGIV